SKFENLLAKIKLYENFSIIIVDDYTKIKSTEFETWFRNSFNVNDGIWIGRGISDQNLLHISGLTKEMTVNYKNDMGYVISENMATLCRFIDYVTADEGDADDK
ncbi:MAG: hypothetical protein IJ093_00920, partial [Bacilli bacterium]|nr:hypothetical protein [Bacilli bacterium]